MRSVIYSPICGGAQLVASCRKQKMTFHCSRESGLLYSCKSRKPSGIHKNPGAANPKLIPAMYITESNVSLNDWCIGLIKSEALRGARPWRCSCCSQLLIYHLQLLRRLIHRSQAKHLIFNTTTITKMLTHMVSTNQTIQISSIFPVFFFFSYACHATKQRLHPQCSRDKPPFSFGRGQDSTMCNIIWVSPQGHRSASVSRHFLPRALQCPCSVRKRLSRDHCCRGRSKPCCRIVGSHTRWELTTWADFQLCLHRLLMSTGCKSSHNGFVDVSRSNGGLSRLPGHT